MASFQERGVVVRIHAPPAQHASRTARARLGTVRARLGTARARLDAERARLGAVRARLDRGWRLRRQKASHRVCFLLQIWILNLLLKW